jgi:hypothetical protein
MTRFTDRVTRDLHQIADRSTPSSTAWDSIRTRIDEQTDQPPTMEVIMLSPDRNDQPKRGWMLAAAAVAGLALVGGLVFATTRSDDDTVPADTPTATLPTEPAPDAEVDPDTDAVVVPAPEPTTAAEVVPEPVPEPVTVTLTGTFSATKEFQSALSRTGIVGEQTWVGRTQFEGPISGTGYDTGQLWNIPGGSFEYIEGDLTATIEGLGVGSLNYHGSAQNVDGVWSSESVIAFGTAAFEGASGTLVLTPDPATPNDSRTGTYEWTITVPPKGSLETVTVNGNGSDQDFAAGRSDVEGEVPYSATSVFEGDMTGLAPHTGTAWVLNPTMTVGVGSFEFTGDIAGLGTGTMTYTDVWVNENGSSVYTVYITGGTGDFEGITGTGRFLDSETEAYSYEFVLTAPVGR